MPRLSLLSLCALLFVACGDADEGIAQPIPDAGRDAMTAAALDAGKSDASADAARAEEQRPDGWVPRPADAGPDADHGEDCSTLPEPTRCALLEIVRSEPPMLTLAKLGLHENPREGSYVLSRLTVYTGGDAGPPDAGAEDGGGEDAGPSFLEKRGLGRCETVAVHDGDWQGVVYWDNVATERFTKRPDWPHGQFSLRLTCGTFTASEYGSLPVLGTTISDDVFVGDTSFVMRGRRSKGPPSYLSFDPLDPVIDFVYERVSD